MHVLIFNEEENMATNKNLGGIYDLIILERELSIIDKNRAAFSMPSSGASASCRALCCLPTLSPLLVSESSVTPTPVCMPPQCLLGKEHEGGAQYCISGSSSNGTPSHMDQPEMVGKVQVVRTATSIGSCMIHKQPTEDT